MRRGKARLGTRRWSLGAAVACCSSRAAGNGRPAAAGHGLVCDAAARLPTPNAGCVRGDEGSRAAAVPASPPRSCFVQASLASRDAGCPVDAHTKHAAATAVHGWQREWGSDALQAPGHDALCESPESTPKAALGSSGQRRRRCGVVRQKGGLQRGRVAATPTCPAWPARELPPTCRNAPASRGSSGLGWGGRAMRAAVPRANETKRRHPASCSRGCSADIDLAPSPQQGRLPNPDRPGFVRHPTLLSGPSARAAVGRRNVPVPTNTNATRVPCSDAWATNDASSFGRNFGQGGYAIPT